MQPRLNLLLATACWLASTFSVPAGVHTWADTSALASGTWVKVALDAPTDGIYQITYQQLRSWGFTSPERVGVYGYGGHMVDEAFARPHIDDVPEVAARHDAAAGRLLFYGQGTVEWRLRDERSGFVQRQNPYATQSVYFLHQKQDDTPRAMDTLATAATSADTTVTTYDERLLHELELVNLGQTGREWYGESFLYQQAQTFEFDDVLEAGDVSVAVSFAATAASSSSLSVRLGGQTVGTLTLPVANTDNYVIATEATLQQTVALGSAVAPTVTLTYTPGTRGANIARLGYIRLQGQRRLELYGREASRLFRSRAASAATVRYKIDSDSNFEVWDVTDATGVAIQTVDSDGTFVAPRAGLREYAVVSRRADATFPSVTRIGTVAPQNLHGLTDIDMLVVTSPQLKTQAERLARHRRDHDGLTVAVVTTEQVYNEFSSGRPDATAIRLLCKMLRDRSATAADGAADASDRITAHTLRYLLLFGDGTYDNRAATPSSPYIPTYQTDASLVETASYCCDDYFGYLDDDEGGQTDSSGRITIARETVDIGVGRIPVASAADADAVVTKIIAYDSGARQGAWKNRLLFLSDDDKVTEKATDTPNSHMQHNEDMVDLLLSQGHEEYVYQKIYLPAYAQTTSASGTDYPAARQEFNEALQQGVLLVNYAGHGNTSSITNEGLMTTARAASLSMRYLPVWVTASCDISRYDADETSMGETLLANPNGGAAALITTTRVVYAYYNKLLNLEIIRNIFNRHADGTRYRLGDVMQAAKARLTDSNRLSFCLLGDPSMTLAYPEQQMELTAIGDTQSATQDEALSASDTIVELPTLRRITMRGRVLQTGTTLTDTTFNGLVYPTIYDAEETIVADKGLHQDPVFTFATRNKKVFTGRDVVERGQFEFSFVVPQDIAYSDATGMVNLYACSDDGDESQGYFDRIILVGSDATTTADTTGPVIRSMFLNSPSFRSGDVVNATPYFYAEVSDSSGFNATGNSIGHDISLSIRSLSNPLLASRQYVLNNYFTTYTGHPAIGNIRYSIPALDDGDYEATLRVWDTFNNTTAASFRFTVSARRAPQAVVVQAYPNPVRQGEPVTFRVMHNRPESATTTRIQVYTQMGQKVWEGTADVSSATVVYPASADTPTRLNTDMNADETGELLGMSTTTWNQQGLSGLSLAPGVYIYRVYLMSGGSDSVSQSKILMIQ